jgi:uncharacterized protein YkwD
MNIRTMVRVCGAALLLVTSPLTVFAAQTTLAVESSQEAKTYPPVWIEKGSAIRFRVTGSWTMWSPSWNPVDARGHGYFKKTDGYHLGTLMGSIGGSAPFAITDGMTLTARESGYLILYPHRAGYKHLATAGSLQVSVEGYTERTPEIPEAARDAILDYRAKYLGSEITDLAWNGNVRTGDAGTLPEATLAKALMRINYFRSLAGLHPVTLSEERNRLAQQAAFMMLANRRLSHYPDKSWKWYTADGAKGAAASNLGTPQLARLLTEFIEDPGESNAACGHRRWLLHSMADEFGFGAAYDPSYHLWSAEALHVVGSRTRPAVIAQYIAWPPAGFIPSPLVFQRGSFVVPAAHGAVNTAAAKVTMSGADGESIPVRRHPEKKSSEPGFTWDIIPAFTSLDSFRLKWHNRPITVKVSGITINGEPRDYEYQFTIVFPDDIP